jgi:type II secretory pathway pseudopilin PulG
MTSDHRGYAMAALLVGMAIMAIMLSVALPVWRTAVQREREAELIFRGEQYAHAIEIFQRRNGGFPQSLDVLEKTRAIRRLYKDPMTGGDFQPVFVGQMIGGVPVAPGQQGRGVAGGPAGARGVPTARGALEAGLARAEQARGGAAGPPAIALTGRGRAGAPIAGQPGIAAAGPIIGVVSRSTADSLRLYNGRGKYNEWAFVAVATTTQAGAPTGAQTPGMPPGRGGRGVQQPGPRGQPPGARPGGPAPRLPFPGRGVQPGGRGAFPPVTPGMRGFGGANVPQPR